jgi:hypothetical protein
MKEQIRIRFVRHEAAWVVQIKKGFAWLMVGNTFFYKKEGAENAMEEMLKGDCMAFHNKGRK